MWQSARSWGPRLWLLSLLAIPAPAQALQLQADTSERGWVGFRAQGPVGATVTVSEQLGSAFQPVASFGLAGGNASLPRATRWRCDRLSRRFVASAPGPLGTETAAAEVHTPSCRRRLRAAVRRRARAGKRVSVRVRDRFGVGELGFRLCTRPPAGHARCRRVVIPPGKKRASPRFRAFRPGRWTLRVSLAGAKPIKRAVRVRPRRGKLRLLATGDSMIQIVDSFLKQRLGGGGPARVRSDARISTGISKPFMFDWVRHARRQAASRPDVTVMFLGANDGFPFGDVSCCGEAWIARYAQRVRAMMRAYKRGRAGVVYWLQLPVPRSRSFAAVFGPVNAAIGRAGASFKGEQVRVIDLRRTFTPDGRFHRVIR